MNTYDMVPLQKALRSNEELSRDKFGDFLAARLGSHERAALGVKMAFTLALMDAQNGKSGFSGQVIPAAVVGHAPQLYALVLVLAMRIAEEVLGEDSARDLGATT